MFISSSKPFKLSSYKKKNISADGKIKLVSSYTCVMCPMVVMAGTVAEKDVVLCKKERNGNLNIDGTIVKASPIQMSLFNLILNFKRSEGLDFLILNLHPYFLLTRQSEDKIRVFMTTTPDYVEIFTNPVKAFGDYPEVINTLEGLFNLKSLKKSLSTERKKQKTVKKSNSEHSKSEEATSQTVNALEDDKSVEAQNSQEEIATEKSKEVPNSENNSFKIQIGKSLSDEEFEKFLIENPNCISIKFGNLVNGEINFTRQAMEKVPNSELSELIDFFSFEQYDFVEIEGNTKIAGYRCGEEFVWFAELPSNLNEEHLYIQEVAKLMNPFTILLEKEEASSE